MSRKSSKKAFALPTCGEKITNSKTALWSHNAYPKSGFEMSVLRFQLSDEMLNY